jgi:hypothetical protein
VAWDPVGPPGFVLGAFARACLALSPKASKSAPGRGETPYAIAKVLRIDGHTAAKCATGYSGRANLPWQKTQHQPGQYMPWANRPDNHSLLLALNVLISLVIPRIGRALKVSCYRSQELFCIFPLKSIYPPFDSRSLGEGTCDELSGNYRLADACGL